MESNPSCPSFLQVVNAWRKTRKENLLRDWGEWLQPLKGEGEKMRDSILQNQMQLRCEPNFCWLP